MDFVKKWNVAYMDKEEQDEFTAEMIEDLAKITAPKDQRIAELEKQVEELGGQSILDTMKRNKALREEISDLCRALSECKAKARVGLNPDK